ncbi:MAG: putative selenium-dependent hydroxylase accessory protein YqeC, partial [Mogibacterium sp.]|nr:putative selenium-dependent hydroxylase accessory protein YqeC [Mogibacterium sp.]
MELNNFKGKQNTITEALQLSIPEHAVICITGAGGKTSLLFAWAHELAAAGKKVIATTTTHMQQPSSRDTEGITFIAEEDPEKPGKLKGPDPASIEKLKESADVVLIEADGARRRPFKWPAPWEPVIPDCTDITVCVVGLTALGCRTEDVMFRADRLPDNLKRDTVDVNLIHAVVSSREGSRKGVRGEFRVFMNQVDDDIDRLAAAYRLQQIFAVLGIQSAWGSLKPRGSAGIAVILEAAGNSTRFGSNKLLHAMEDGRPMISGILEAVRPLYVYKKILVTQYEEVASLAPDFDVVINGRPDLGISHSMQLGIGAAGDADAYMFCVCDQPYIKTGTLESMIEEYKKGTAGIISLSWKGKMCNPKIFSSRYRDELMALTGDTGGRQIIGDHIDELTLIE